MSDPFVWTAEDAARAQRNAAVRAASAAISGQSFSSFGRAERRDIALHIMLRSLHRQARFFGIPTSYASLRYALDRDLVEPEPQHRKA